MNKFYISRFTCFLFLKQGLLDDELHWTWLVILHRGASNGKKSMIWHWHYKAQLEKNTHMHTHTIYNEFGGWHLVLNNILNILIFQKHCYEWKLMKVSEWIMGWIFHGIDPISKLGMICDTLAHQMRWVSMNANPWKSYKIINGKGYEKSSKVSHAQYHFYQSVLSKTVVYKNCYALPHLFQIFFPYMWVLQKGPHALHGDLNAFSLWTTCFTNCNKCDNNSANQGNKLLRKSEGYSAHNYQAHEMERISVLTQSYVWLAWLLYITMFFSFFFWHEKNSMERENTTQ